MSLCLILAKLLIILLLDQSTTSNAIVVTTCTEGTFSIFKEAKDDEDPRNSTDLTYMELESRIGRALLTPPYANGPMLLKDLDEYVARLERILQAFELELDVPKPKKFAKQQMMIIGKYGPKVYRLHWDQKHLMDVYKWDETKLNRVLARLKDIENLWNTVVLYMKW